MQKKMPKNVLNSFEVMRTAKKEVDPSLAIYLKQHNTWTWEGASYLVDHLIQRQHPDQGLVPRHFRNSNIYFGAYARKMRIFSFEYIHYLETSGELPIVTESPQYHRFLKPYDSAALIKYPNDKNLKRRGRVMVIADCYADKMNKRLLDYYDEVLHVHVWHHDWSCEEGPRRDLKKIVESYNPQLVIIGFSESRFWENAPPHCLIEGATRF